MKRTAITVCKSMQENNLTQEHEKRISLKALQDMVINPVQSITKGDCGYLVPFTHNFSEGNSMRRKEFAKELTWMFIDVDGGYSIEEMKDFCKGYKYVYYSSYSHFKDDSTPKFRFILQLPKPVDFSFYSLDYVRIAILKRFPMMDENTIKYGGFYAPCFDKARSENYYEYGWNDNGIDFDFEKEIQPFVLKAKVELNMKQAESKKRLKALKRKSKHYKNQLTAEKSSSVVTYLATPYLNYYGNGDSNLNLYKAILACLRIEDTNTLNHIVNKAKNEYWSDIDIDRKINDARKFLARA